MATKDQISKDLIEIINDDPIQLETIINELILKLNEIQLNEIEDLIVNQFSF